MGQDEVREARELQALGQRLAAEYAWIRPDVVHREVRAAYHRFDGAPVRSYVIVLTERMARGQLAVLPTDATATQVREASA